MLACLDLWADAAGAIASQLSALGAPVQLMTRHSDQELQAAIEHAHAFVWAWGPDLPDPGGGVLEAIVGDLPVHRDDELDRLLDRAAALRDQDERLRLYREYERGWIGEQAAVVPFAYADSTLSRRPWVTGMWINAIGMSSVAEAIVDRQ